MKQNAAFSYLDHETKGIEELIRMIEEIQGVWGSGINQALKCSLPQLADHRFGWSNLEIGGISVMFNKRGGGRDCIGSEVLPTRPVS